MRKTAVESGHQSISAQDIFVTCVVAFVLNFIWEWIQCTPFFIHPAPPTFLAMVSAAVGDVVLIALIISISILADRNKNYKSIQNFLKIELAAFLIAVIVEKYAISTHRWSYTELNPLIPFLNVSLISTLQLMILSPIIFRLLVSRDQSRMVIKK